MPDLNKPAAVGGRGPVWITGSGPHPMPKWYLWEGGFLVIGQAGGEVPAHSHHAIQIFLGLDGAAAIRPAGSSWREGRGVIVRPDVEHSFNARGALGALLFVDPESSEGAWLGSVLAEDITIAPQARLQGCLDELAAFLQRPLESLDAPDLVRHCVQAFCAGTPPNHHLDDRVTTILRKIREADDLRMSLETAASMVHLSPGRFAHLFKEQVGLPFRRYMLWRKLTRAMLAVGREANIAVAAQVSGFADGAHLTRTFHQMFGIPPSVMMRGQFHEIASPFAPSG